jgi:hypothetical protein
LAGRDSESLALGHPIEAIAVSPGLARALEELRFGLRHGSLGWRVEALLVGPEDEGLAREGSPVQPGPDGVRLEGQVLRGPLEIPGPRSEEIFYPLGGITKAGGMELLDPRGDGLAFIMHPPGADPGKERQGGHDEDREDEE